MIEVTRRYDDQSDETIRRQRTSCDTSEINQKDFDDITAGQFLEERLKEIGLKK